MTPKAPAVPEDGAKFYGSVRAMPNGEWRASCATHLGVGSGFKDEEPQSRVFETEDDARAWIASVGMARGFTSMVWDE